MNSFKNTFSQSSLLTGGITVFLMFIMLVHKHITYITLHVLEKLYHYIISFPWIGGGGLICTTDWEPVI